MKRLLPILLTLWAVPAFAQQPVTVTSSALPTGAATSAAQTTGNTSLSSIDGKIVAVNTGAVVVASGTISATQSGTWNIGTVTTLTGITNALPAGSNAIGHVVLDAGTAEIGNVKNSGTFATQAAQSGTWNITNVSGTVSLPTGAATAAKQPALGTAGSASTDVITIQGIASMTKLLVTPDANSAVNVAQINGVTPLMGNGASGTGAQRVTIANDSTGIISLTTGSAQIGHLEANQSSNVAQINGVTPLMGAGNTGTGSSRVTLATDQAAIATWGMAATGAAVPSGGQYAAGNGSGNLTGITVCDLRVAISLTTNTQIVTGTSAKHVYICSINLVVAAATNVALVSGTGTVCATGIGGIAGGTTAATGWNFAANGGIAMGTGLGWVMRTVATGDNVCLLVSAANQTSGSISYTVY